MEASKFDLKHRERAKRKLKALIQSELDNGPFYLREIIQNSRRGAK